MRMQAQAVTTGQWTEAEWARALASRPDLVERLNGGDTSALAQIIELMPGASVRSLSESTSRDEASSTSPS
jgi:hypothetical protein